MRMEDMTKKHWQILNVVQVIVSVLVLIVAMFYDWSKAVFMAILLMCIGAGIFVRGKLDSN